MKAEMTTCERCGNSFVCNAQDISACHCSNVQLTDIERKYIAAKYNNCLCGKCLQQSKSDFNALGDYYVENGFYVFTEKFLLKRGFCCRSGCRHCPYGFKKTAVI